jgi:hypothetical protein
MKRWKVRISAPAKERAFGNLIYVYDALMELNRNNNTMWLLKYDLLLIFYPINLPNDKISNRMCAKKNLFRKRFGLNQSWLYPYMCIKPNNYWKWLCLRLNHIILVKIHNVFVRTRPDISIKQCKQSAFSYDINITNISNKTIF